MSLADWARNGWLTKHKMSQNEIRDLLSVVDRDLADSVAQGLSPDWRMNIAYNAALQAATAALAVAGYRASRDQHHYRVIQSLREKANAAELSSRWAAGLGLSNPASARIDRPDCPMSRDRDGCGRVTPVRGSTLRAELPRPGEQASSRPT